MTVVPHPGVAAVLGPEVGLAVVVDLRGEAQQAPVARGQRGVVGRAGQAVLLQGTLQQEHGPVLQVGRLLHQLRVQHQVRGGCSEGWRRLVKLKNNGRVWLNENTSKAAAGGGGWSILALSSSVPSTVMEWFGWEGV